MDGDSQRLRCWEHVSAAKAPSSFGHQFGSATLNELDEFTRGIWDRTGIDLCFAGEALHDNPEHLRDLVGLVDIQ